MDGAERSSVQLKRETHVVDRGGTVDQAKLLPEPGIEDGAKIRTLRERLADHLRIRVQQ